MLCDAGKWYSATEALPPKKRLDLVCPESFQSFNLAVRNFNKFGFGYLNTETFTSKYFLYGENQ